jgi:uncharacterized protein (TIGR02145 family)
MAMLKNLLFTVFYLSALCLVQILFNSCEKEDPAKPATINTLEITAITGNAAKSGGNITDTGNAEITSRGVVWGISDKPTIDAKEGLTTDGKGSGQFASNLTGLTPGKKYYVRSYAVNSAGTSYGNQMEFITHDLATIAITEINEITATSAKINSNIPDDGGAVISVRGVVWGITENPTVDNNNGKTTDGEGAGVFTSSVTELSRGTNYNVRAYATNSEGTSYGVNMTFTTLAVPPDVATMEISYITHNSAKSGGEVIDDGGSEVTVRGVLWGKTAMPTLENNSGQTNDGSGSGDYVSTISGLNPSTTYYVRAYATNNLGTSYGSEKVLSTLQDINLPTAITSEPTGITATSVKIAGEITDPGIGQVLLRGICWATTENPVLGTNNFSDEGSGTGNFESIITGLNSGQTYYARVFASSSIGGIGYGNQVSFTLLPGPPSVSLGMIINSASGVTRVNATVSHDGGAEVTARGFVWSRQENPELGLNEGESTIGSGTGVLSADLTDLVPNTFYFVRAYAENIEGIAYSEQYKFNFWDYHATVSDMDGNTYNTVMIGEQEWMTENLKVTRYRDGVLIASGLSNEEWGNTEAGAYSVYPYNNEYAIGIDSEEEMLSIYGALYNWHAYENSRGVCPTGWRVASETDWDELENYIISNSHYTSDNIVNALKSARQVDSPLGVEYATNEHPRWETHISNIGRNDFGFSALPAGIRSNNGEYHFHIGIHGSWWASTELSHTLTNALSNSIESYNGTVSKAYQLIRAGLSVRCTREE